MGYLIAAHFTRWNRFVCGLSHHCNACRTPLLAWFSSWVLASMSRRASFSCIAAGPWAGPVQAVLSHAPSLLWEVSELSYQRCESCRLRSFTSQSLIFFVVGLLSAAVAHYKFGERAFTYDGPSAWNSLPKDLTCCHWSWICQKTTRFQFGVLCLLTLWMTL